MFNIVLKFKCVVGLSTGLTWMCNMNAIFDMGISNGRWRATDTHQPDIVNTRYFISLHLARYSVDALQIIYFQNMFIILIQTLF